MKDNEIYGIDKDHAHPRAIELIPEVFFWSCGDDWAPFGSDEGDTALSEFREWRRDNPNLPVMACVKWTVEGVGEIRFEDYNESILNESLLSEQISDHNFDDQQFVYTLDISIIGTIFGQLVDEGTIDENVKPICDLAIFRQIL